ncbi:MAG: phenylalanine--tRNA ligase subunit beta [Ferruginibacter sp.]|nr:phenylalanine--tRNA ligase subunit beta [Ferruginibacter sp.]
MTISYNWLSEYLPEKIEIEKLSGILTGIGLEVESVSSFEEIKGGLEGLVVGEVVSCEKHPDADKLKVTTVNIGEDKMLHIVCGAANVATGQKVVVAPVGITIYPTSGDPIKLKKAKIRGLESEGMICAEDEIGLNNNHDGILVLPAETAVGMKVSAIFKPQQDHIFEIGLTPNRMDAMSHLGVAKDVCAWLSYHNKKETNVLFPYHGNFNAGNQSRQVTVIIENEESCRRYSGVSISGITVSDSPLWLQQKLKAIGLKPINNIVDITNFILHETGQPLHAFDADKIKGNKVIVRNAGEGTVFKTLDDKERKLAATDLVICNAEEIMCLAGVYGGINSGVTKTTTNIFLESAWFDPISIRKTSVKHGLRTDAAARFEKGTDISNTIPVLKRAALLVKDIAGGEISTDITDQYPAPLKKTTVGLKNHYLKKLSGKNYHPDQVKNILQSLGFEVVKEGTDELWVDVPYSKPDISLPADIVEEIMRIDGLDNIEIPASITISPSVEKNQEQFKRKEKLAGYLTGFGFYEIFTNSITDSKFYEEATLSTAVKMINSLSADLDMLRPEMIQGGLQVIAHNINRKNTDLRFFEFGKTYGLSDAGKYVETTHLTLYVSGNTNEQHWKIKPAKTDLYYLKGAVERVVELSGIKKSSFETVQNQQLKNGSVIKSANKILGYLGEVNEKMLKQFDIKFPVFYADLNWDMITAISSTGVEYREISKFPAVTRDLALVVDKNVSYNQIEGIALSCKIQELRSVHLFDVFESDKLGAGMKSMAVSFIFLDERKTLTDKEIDIFMQKIISSYEESVGAEIRK